MRISREISMLSIKSHSMALKRREEQKSSAAVAEICLLYFFGVRLGALSFGGEIFLGAGRAYPAVSNDSVA